MTHAPWNTELPIVRKFEMLFNVLCANSKVIASLLQGQWLFSEGEVAKILYEKKGLSLFSMIRSLFKLPRLARFCRRIRNFRQL